MLLSLRSRRVYARPIDTALEDEESLPPICIRCGVTMVPAELSADDVRGGEWVCLECEELGEHE